MMSVVDSTNKNNENGGSSKQRDSKDKTDESRKNGINSLRTIKAAIKKGSKTVVNRYTDDMVNDEILAMFPVPKNAMLMKIRKKLAMRISLDFKVRGLDTEADKLSAYVVPLNALVSKKNNCCSISIHTKIT